MGPRDPRLDPKGAVMTGRLVLQMQVSLDGRMAAADPSLDWQVWDWGDQWTWDDALKRDFNAFFESAGGILLSRKMAEEGYHAHWSRVAQRGAGNPHYAFAQRIVDLEKFVATRTLRTSRWDRTTLVRGDLGEAIRRWKSRSRGDLIAFGGIELGSSLVAGGLVDEYQFFVNPTAVGDGLSIFDNIQRGTRLRTMGCKEYPCGIVVSRYAHARR